MDNDPTFDEPDLTGWLTGHDIMRRQFGQLADAATQVGARDTARLTALEDHLAFMVRRLTWHHHHEDDDLFPGLRERDSSLSRLLDDLETEHHSIDAAIDAATETATPFHRRAAALRELHTRLVDHLEHEEAQAVPAIRRLIPQSAWALEDAKFLAELGAERELTTLWLLSHVPPPARAGILASFPPDLRHRVVHTLLPAHTRHVELLYGA